MLAQRSIYCYGYASVGKSFVPTMNVKKHDATCCQNAIKLNLEIWCNSLQAHWALFALVIIIRLCIHFQRKIYYALCYIPILMYSTSVQHQLEMECFITQIQSIGLLLFKRVYSSYIQLLSIYNLVLFQMEPESCI